jgi:F0F1-type ATP synthase epsilon subunit
MAEVAAGIPTMHVKIHSPFKVYFDGDAVSLTATNRTGPFDILPQHKNFMTLLIPSTLTVRATDKPDFTLEVTRGVMHVKADQIIVFLDV